MSTANIDRFDWIRFEYIVDHRHHRTAPTEAEKTLRCLFVRTNADGEDYADDVFLPCYHVRVYINDQLCWNEWCDFAELGKMLEQSGDFTPFIPCCRHPGDPDLIDVIHSTNDKEVIEWRTNFPRPHVTGCDDCEEAFHCPNLDWSCSTDPAKITEHHYRFSAGRFKEELTYFLQAISAVDHMAAFMLGKVLSYEEMQSMAKHCQKCWQAFDEFNFKRYVDDRKTIKTLLDDIAARKIGADLRNHYDVKDRIKVKPQAVEKIQ